MALTETDVLKDVMTRIRTLEETVAGYERAELNHSHLLIARADVLAALGALIDVAHTTALATFYPHDGCRCTQCSNLRLAQQEQPNPDES